MSRHWSISVHIAQMTAHVHNSGCMDMHSATKLVPQIACGGIVDGSLH